MNAATSQPQKVETKAPKTTPPAENPEEAAAARVALEGGLAQRMWVGVRALRRLLKDPNDTRQVFVMGLAMNAHRFPQFVTRFVTDPSGAALLRDRPAIDSRSVDFAALGALPADTLGGAFARHMKDANLDPDLFQPPPGLPEAAAYIVQRVRQTHDLWHLLTGYKTDIPGELALQGFYYGLIGMPSSLLISVLGTLRYARHFQSLRPFRMVHDGYRRGRKAAFLPTVPWETMWTLPLSEVRRQLNVEPVAA